jgi:cytochrome c-type biogenesis protein CcmF
LDPHFKETIGLDLFLGKAGSGLVYAAVGFFLLSAIFGIRKAEKQSRLFFISGASALFLTFGCLAALFIREQFAYQYIGSHSAKDLPIAYRIAAVWSGQQGSFLLWAVTSAIFGLLTLRATGKLQRTYLVIYSLFLAALAAILAFETPFGLNAELFANGKWINPGDGAGLSPSLQNYWVIIHPPIMFLGFGSLTVGFAWTIAAMLGGDTKEWVSRFRPWAILSATITGLGLCLGGFWAYETLNWGGFWAWDPVENVSFVPWLFGIASVHGIIVQATRGRWIGSNFLLAGVPFVLFCFGTLMTRSGVLGESSVHSFAQMDRTALKLLLGILVLSLGALAIVWGRYGLRLAKANEPAKEETESMTREGAYQLGVMLLCLIAGTTAVGMSWPFFTGLTGKPAVVEAALYHKVVTWFFIPAMLLTGVAPFLGWKSTSNRLVKSLPTLIGLTLLLSAGFLFYIRSQDWIPKTTIRVIAMDIPATGWVTFLVTFTFFSVIANVWRIIESLKAKPLGWGGFIAHIGVAMLMSGLIISLGLQRHEQAFLERETPSKVLNHSVTVGKMTKPDDLFNRDNQVLVTMQEGKDKYIAEPGLYYLQGNGNEDKAMVWPSIKRGISHDVYLTLHQPVIKVFETEPEVAIGKPFQNEVAKIVLINKIAPVNPRAPDAKFGARLEITLDGKTTEVSPMLKMGPDGLTPELTPLGTDYFVAVTSLPAGPENPITVQIFLKRPLFPVELFYKPMTFLVFLGTGILTLGGLMAALYRRHRPRPSAGSDLQSSEPIDRKEV